MSTAGRPQSSTPEPRPHPGGRLLPGGRAGRRARALAAREARTLDRPIGAGRPGSFPLTWLRTGPTGLRTRPGSRKGPAGLPILVIPGGPGMASALLYRGFRRRAAARGLDVIMVEHRGVGLSRRDAQGRDLPREAVTLEAAAADLAAVLDAAGAEQAVVVGSSYGTYLAQLLAVRHPERVAALVLDSPILSVEGDLAMTRAHRRALLWEGEDQTTAHLAALVRAQAGRGEPMPVLTQVVATVYEFCGPEVLERLLRARARGRLSRLWDLLAQLGTAEIGTAESAGTTFPFVLEPDLVEGIAYGELGYALPPDGGPLDPQLLFAPIAHRVPPFRGEPVDLRTEAPRYGFPTLVLSGDRDLRTPRPIARALAELAPRGMLLELARTGHSVLDTHQEALLEIMALAASGQIEQAPDRAAALADLPRRGISPDVGALLSAVIRAATRR